MQFTHLRRQHTDMRPTTAEKKDAAVHLLSQGLSIRKVAMQTGISSAAVGRIARDMPKRRCRKAGRPPLLSANDKRKITRDITSGSYNTAVQAAEGLARNAGVIVSANTVRHVLKENGLHSAQKIKKPMLSVHHHITRMEFAVRHKDWTVDDWRKVVWSDETKINRLGSDGQEWCWKYHGESLSN